MPFLFLPSFNVLNGCFYAVSLDLVAVSIVLTLRNSVIQLLQLTCTEVDHSNSSEPRNSFSKQYRRFHEAGAVLRNNTGPFLFN